MRWAWIPAAILGLMGLLILIAAEELINYIWPSALIFAGLLLIGRSLRRK
jgi:ABC-type phosphate transport system auxiliary subunit